MFINIRHKKIRVLYHGVSWVRFEAGWCCLGPNLITEWILKSQCSPICWALKLAIVGAHGGLAGESDRLTSLIEAVFLPRYCPVGWVGPSFLGSIMNREGFTYVLKVWWVGLSWPTYFSTIGPWPWLMHMTWAQFMPLCCRHAWLLDLIYKCSMPGQACLAPCSCIKSFESSLRFIILDMSHSRKRILA